MAKVQQTEYDYTTAGFDGFFSRSVDDIPQQNLDSAGPRSTAIRYDSAGVSGMLGDTLQIGLIRITNDSIIVSDGDNDRLLIGNDNT